MRVRFFSGLCVLFCSLALVSAGSTRSVEHRKTLGSVVETNNAHVDSQSAVAGANLYRCDVLDTDDSGALRAQLSTSQIYLSSLSEDVLDEDAQGTAEVLLIRGSTGFSLPASGSIILVTPAGILRGNAGQAGAGQVVITGPHELVISAIRGDLVLDNGGQLQTVPEGKSARVTYENTPDDSCHEPGAIRPISSHKIAFYIIGGAAGAIPIYFLWHHASESTYKPNN
jgi:hypothetical protein